MEEKGDTAVLTLAGDMKLNELAKEEVQGQSATGEGEKEVGEKRVSDVSQDEDKEKATEKGSESPTSATVTFMDTKKPGIDCSLLQLFKCQYFDMWLTIWYLHKYSRNVGVTDYLSNHLYSYSIHEIQFYLPQLCVLLLNGPPTVSLERFLLDTCSNYMHIAFQTMWHLQAYIDTYSSPPHLDEAKLRVCLRLHESVEAAAVNGGGGPEPYLLTLPPVYSPQVTTDGPMKEEEKDDQKNGSTRRDTGGSSSGESLDPSILKRYLAKRKRSEYFDNVTQLINNLVQLSDKVMQAPPPVRQEKLRAEVTKINENIPESGLYVPIDEIRRPHTCIVRIPPSEAFLLDSNSKTHTTYIIYMETVESNSDCSAPNIHLFSRTPYSPSPSSSRRGSVSEGEKENAHIETRGRAPTSPEKGLLQWDPAQIEEREKKDKEKRAEVSRIVMKARNEDLPFPGIKLYVVDGEREKRLSPEEKDKNEWKYISEMERKDKAKGGNTKEQKGLGMELHASFAEDWETKAERIRESSPYRERPNWVLRSLIVKYDECRQELLAAQLIAQFQAIFDEANLPLPLYPMSVLVVSSNCGLIETLPNAISLHQLHKHSGVTSLIDHFRNSYPESPDFEAAQLQFCQSLAAYSVVTYLLQVKDRHNGNILLLKDGRLIHIDFGYFLSNSPRNLNFESAPFKLTQEFVDVLGGVNSEMYRKFKSLVISGFLAARKHMDKIILLVEIALKGPALPCLAVGEDAVNSLRDRFQRGLTEEQFIDHVEGLIATSLDNFYTRTYDKYQWFTRGILY